MTSIRKSELRQAYEVETWRVLNKRGGYVPTLFDAGALGFCVLRWTGIQWTNQWFDEAEKLPRKAKR